MTAFTDFHRRSIEDRDAFWAEQARLIDWAEPFDTVCDYSRPPFAKWFAGGRTNLCHNAVDRHLATRAEQRALVYVSTETDTETVYTFGELHAEVQRMGGARLARRRHGRPLLIYMPMIPEAVFAMLACARIGAVHCVVFGGFASVSLATRIDDAEPEVIVSADAGSRAGKVIPYKPLLDEAIRMARHKPKRVWSTAASRDASKRSRRAYAGLREGIARHVNCNWVDATHPSYTLYTGQDGPAKGGNADTGGYAVSVRRAGSIFGPSGRNRLLGQRHRLGGGHS